ncbi:hypothetical protein B0H13DRAFT_2488558 [Mycena leptocephala]|nr:hypothetical protein B0H13DRAFT_2488558 [Mycena leptocephala]
MILASAVRAGEQQGAIVALRPIEPNQGRGDKTQQSLRCMLAARNKDVLPPKKNDCEEWAMGATNCMSQKSLDRRGSRGSRPGDAEEFEPSFPPSRRSTRAEPNGREKYVSEQREKRRWIVIARVRTDMLWNESVMTKRQAGGQRGDGTELLDKASAPGGGDFRGQMRHGDAPRGKKNTAATLLDPASANFHSTMCHKMTNGAEPAGTAVPVGRRRGQEVLLQLEASKKSRILWLIKGKNSG